MSEIDARFVKRGLWTNLEKGTTTGLTITTDPRTGTLIIALLAVLSTLGTAHLWHLVTFLIHQLRADGNPADALFRQQQALLRTLPPPSTVIADTLKLWWSWRGRAKRPLFRSMVLLVLAVVFTLATLAASVFSSMVVDSGTLEVLVSSPYCGWATSERNTRHYASSPVKTVAVSYAGDCYRNTTTQRGCDVFTRSKVPLTTTNVSCPFGTLCPHESAVSVDSGLLDVGKTFGLNLPHKDQVQYRKLTTCQVLPVDGYTKVAPFEKFKQTMGRDALPNEEVMHIDFGGSILHSPTYAPTNITVVTGLTLANITRLYDQGSFIYYSSSQGPQGSKGPQPSGFMKFDPIPDLKRGDGDTVVTVVGFNSVPYRTPVDDPFFTAHVPRDTFGYNTNNTRANFTTYNADNGLRAMGCLQQYQFCHSVKSKPQFCTTLGGLPGDATPELFPDANDIQLAVLKLLVTSSISFDKANGAPLLAEGLTDPEGFVTKYAISNEHWKKEVTWVESTVWAALQTAIADYAAGPQVRDPASDWVKPASRGEKELCGMQKMRKSGGIVNINVLGLILVVSVAGLVTIIDISLLRFLIFLTRFRTALAPRIDRWIQDGVWQLQRRAYEAQGYAWVDLEGEIPLTAPNEQLKDLPVMWLPAKAMANIALGIGVPPRLETKQSTFSLRSPATWSSKSVKSVSGWLWREKSAEELGVGTAPEIRR